MDLDNFVIHQNIQRYRRLATAANTETDRKMLLGLLAEEEDKRTTLQELQIAPTG